MEERRDRPPSRRGLAGTRRRGRGVLRLAQMRLSQRAALHRMEALQVKLFALSLLSLIWLGYVQAATSPRQALARGLLAAPQKIEREDLARGSNGEPTPAADTPAADTPAPQLTARPRRARRSSPARDRIQAPKPQLPAPQAPAPTPRASLAQPPARRASAPQPPERRESARRAPRPRASATAPAPTAAIKVVATPRDSGAPAKIGLAIEPEDVALAPPAAPSQRAAPAAWLFAACSALLLGGVLYAWVATRPAPPAALAQTSLPAPTSTCAAASIVLVSSRGGRYAMAASPGVPVTLGRSHLCDLQVEDMEASQTHARILFDGRSLQLCDCSSTNGTWLNGERITSAILQAGDAIHIGATSLVLQ